MSHRHMPREQKFDMMRLRSNNPAIKIARDFGCSDRTVRRVNQLAVETGGPAVWKVLD
jgi:transposase-like protein